MNQNNSSFETQEAKKQKQATGTECLDVLGIAKAISVPALMNL